LTVSGNFKKALAINNRVVSAKKSWRFSAEGKVFGKKSMARTADALSGALEDQSLVIDLKKWRFFQIKGEDLTNAGATLSIPVNNVKFESFDGGGAESGVGTYVAETDMALTDQLLYTADASEYSDTWVTVAGVLKVFVPYGTTTDYYGGDMTITMTE